MMNRKGSITMTTVVISILLTMALFYAGYSYIYSNYESANITDTFGYNQSYSDLQDSQTELKTNVDDMQTAAGKIVEADANIFLVAWNGLTGLSATIHLFFNIIDVGLSVFNALFPALGFLPTWVKLLATIAIIVTIILVIVGAFKGESTS